MNQVGFAKQQASKIFATVFTTVNVSIDWHMSRSGQSLPASWIPIRALFALLAARSRCGYSPANFYHFQPAVSLF